MATILRLLFYSCILIVCTLSFQLLHKRVDSLDKKYSAASGMLTFKLKDFKVIQMDIPSVEDCMNIAQSVEQLSNIGKTYNFMNMLILNELSRQ